VRWLPQIGDLFPDFSVTTTQGPLRFWEWAESSWVHLFSHPAALTPVCTTEMAALADCGPECRALKLKNLALSGSSIDEQLAWHDDITRLFGVTVDFPCAVDPGNKLSRLFGMMHDKESTAWPIRKSFLIDPALRVRLIFEYPFFVGRNIEEVLRTTRALQLHDETGAATPADWDQGDLVIIPDKRPEAEVLRQFQAESQHLTSYLRVVENRRGGSVPQD
jgi:peroxiredoxin (alkyl hydroperoxide reductase subunit C)